MLVVRLLCCFNLLVVALAVTSCHKFRTCRSCVENRSWWFSKSCRWCRLSSSCHTFMSADNQCNGAEDVHHQVAGWQQECDVPLKGRFKYDPGTSLKALLASAAAYKADEPGPCLKKLLPESNYRVIRSDVVQCENLVYYSQCAGYLAYSVKERTLLVAFRGSESAWQVVKEVLESLAVPKEQFLDGQVQSYFLRAFNRLWAKMRGPFNRLRSRYPKYRVLVTGHSLGGAIASLASVYMIHESLVPRDRLVLYTFGMPRVGNYDYALQHSRLVPHSFRVVNGHDPVPHYPVKLGTPSSSPYHHGLEVHYENAQSVDSEWKECRGMPFNEDFECGWSAVNHLLSDHFNYFGLRVGSVCWNQSHQVAVVILMKNGTLTFLLCSRMQGSKMKRSR